MYVKRQGARDKDQGTRDKEQEARHKKECCSAFYFEKLYAFFKVICFRMRLNVSGVMPRKEASMCCGMR